MVHAFRGFVFGGLKYRNSLMEGWGGTGGGRLLKAWRRPGNEGRKAVTGQGATRYLCRSLAQGLFSPPPDSKSDPIIQSPSISPDTKLMRLWRGHPDINHSIILKREEKLNKYIKILPNSRDVD